RASAAAAAGAATALTALALAAGATVVPAGRAAGGGGGGVGGVGGALLYGVLAVALGPQLAARRHGAKRPGVAEGAVFEGHLPDGGRGVRAEHLTGTVLAAVERPVAGGGAGHRMSGGGYRVEHRGVAGEVGRVAGEGSVRGAAAVLDVRGAGLAG